MFVMSFRTDPALSRTRKLEIVRRFKQNRRPIDKVLDQQFRPFETIDEHFDSFDVPVTARPRPYLWEMAL